jgi:hypothetical protein
VTPTPTVTVTVTVTIVWPRLRELQPAQATPNQIVQVLGSGGYRQAGSFYDESARSFGLTLAGRAVGEFGCYVNSCQGSFRVPAGLAPGTYEVATEGGSHLTLTIVAP